MECVILKSGLTIFDATRAYGLAQLLQVLAAGKSSPKISDQDQVFVLTIATPKTSSDWKKSDLWRAVFAENNWQRVFLTYKKAWSGQRDKVRKTLESGAEQCLQKAEKGGLVVNFEGESLPGPLDPVGFKGLKGLTAGNYSEGQTLVDEINWALGCLGAAVAQRYKVQKAFGNKWEYYVTLPVPEEVLFSDFNQVRQLVYDKGLAYSGVRNAAAHFTLLLADAVRQKAEGNPRFPARFSNVLYFSLFQSGQQFKPSVGGSVSLIKIIDLSLSRPDVASEMFKVWDYLFRRGSAQGNEDLALAVTELVMTPSLDTYYRHARIFNRYIVDRTKGVKHDNLYTEAALREVMNYVEQRAEVISGV
jgi:hypothetical protein